MSNITNIENDKENKRLEALKIYDLNDTTPEQDLDEITEAATLIFQAPIAVISLVDKTKILIKSAFGMERGEIIRDAAFCDLFVCSVTFFYLSIFVYFVTKKTISIFACLWYILNFYICWFCGIIIFIFLSVLWYILYFYCCLFVTYFLFLSLYT